MSTDLPNPISPTVDDVAALIRARTKDNNGNEVGTFTADTRPTAAQAQEAIDHQVILLHTKVGAIGPGCTSIATMAAAYGAAAEIELSYFPEQARTDRSPYTYLIARWEEYAEGLVQCVEGNLPTDDPDAVDGAGLRYGTVDAISGTVSAYYTGRAWPALPPWPEPELPPEPAPTVEPVEAVDD
jgi:hypothetical protein